MIKLSGRGLSSFDFSWGIYQSVALLLATDEREKAIDKRYRVNDSETHWRHGVGQADNTRTAVENRPRRKHLASDVNHSHDRSYINIHLMTTSHMPPPHRYDLLMTAAQLQARQLTENITGQITLLTHSQLSLTSCRS